ncbi:hypothetical protein [Tsukamurella tyrosinosolvens]|uniref:hypothetical protein n=1 Tax=Tsukamurella tyrosinosolvens TaxID=57704 RepID=UPI0034619FF8
MEPAEERLLQLRLGGSSSPDRATATNGIEHARAAVSRLADLHAEAPLRSAHFVKRRVRGLAELSQLRGDNLERCAVVAHTLSSVFERLTLTPDDLLPAASDGVRERPDKDRQAIREPLMERLRVRELADVGARLQLRSSRPPRQAGIDVEVRDVQGLNLSVAVRESSDISVFQWDAKVSLQPDAALTRRKIRAAFKPTSEWLGSRRSVERTGRRGPDRPRLVEELVHGGSISRRGPVSVERLAECGRGVCSARFSRGLQQLVSGDDRGGSITAARSLPVRVKVNLVDHGNLLRG